MNTKADLQTRHFQKMYVPVPDLHSRNETRRTLNQTISDHGKQTIQLWTPANFRPQRRKMPSRIFEPKTLVEAGEGREIANQLQATEGA